MKHLALTGNVAAGKSSVAQLFAEWGATVIDADAIVHDLQRPGTTVYQTIVREFGPEVERPGGGLDRPALRRRVLNDPAARARLEAIVHPEVAARRDALIAEAAARGSAVVLSDIPLLFEVGDPAAFDAVILVDAPEPVRRDRLVRLRGLPPDEADRLMAAQEPSAGKRARSDYVIDNAGTEAELEAAARMIWDAVSAGGNGA